MYVFVHLFNIASPAARSSIRMADDPPWKRLRTARFADAEAYAATEPEAEQPASQAGEEPVIDEPTTEQSTGAPSTPSPETCTPSQVFFRDLSDIRVLLDHADCICGYLLAQNGVLYRMHGASASHLAKSLTLQRDMLEIMDRVDLQAVELVAALEADALNCEDAEDIQGS
jgi:hypothetical protein